MQLFVNEGTNNFSYQRQQMKGLYINGDIRSLSILSGPDPHKLIVGRNNLPAKTLQIAKKEVGKTVKK